MKGRISIEVDFDNSNQPVIQILQAINSDDVRDKLISNFLSKFSGSSSWCQVKWHDGTADFSKITISPITADMFKEQSETMLEQLRVYEKCLEKEGIDMKKYYATGVLEYQVHST